MGILASEFKKLEEEIESYQQVIRDEYAKREAQDVEIERLTAQVEKLRHGLTVYAMYSVFSSPEESVEHARKILAEVPAPDLVFHDTKERINGAESFKNELLKSTSFIFHPHFEGVFAVWARQQRKDP